LRPSELVMQEIQKFKARRPQLVSEKLQQEAEYHLQEYVRRRAKESNVPEALIEQQLEADAESRTHVVETEALPGAPFFRVIPRGGQVVLLINEGHRFYDDLYAAFESSPQLRARLELLLFVIGEAGLDAHGDRRRFYEAERTEWSRVLNTALDRLGEMDATEFEAEAEDVLDDLSSEEIGHIS
jgi:hypothetical protein